MADNTNTTGPGNIPEMDDTKTRKTLKLKPIGAKEEKEIVNPVVDPLTMRNTETGPLGTMDDTRTRKTVKLKATKTGIITLEDTPKVELKTVIDPLTIRNTETGPLGAMVDTRTRKTVKLKPLKTAGDNIAPIPAPADAAPILAANPEPAAEPAPDAPAAESEDASKTMQNTNTRRTLKLKAVKSGEAKADAGEAAPKDLTDTNTRKTLKLKAVKPGETKADAGESAPKTLKDTNTRKTLKLKAIKPGEAKADTAEKSETPAPAADIDLEATQALAPIPATPSKATSNLTAKAAEEQVADADTIKIERPKKKADVLPMPSLGVTAAAKTVNNKETVKLRPSAAVKPEEKDTSGSEATAKASKETIKLSPTPAPKKSEVPAAKKDKEEAPAVNLKLDEKKPAKSKLTIGKAPPPKSSPKEDVEAPEGKAGGLKLKSMAPKTEAPRALADQQKIKEIKKGKKGNSEASMLYTIAAVISVVLVAFSALVSVSQFFDFWEKENPVGQQIVPHVKGAMTELMKSLK